MVDRELQIQIAERLQLLVLKEFERRLTATPPEITDTGMATLCRLLSQNGWSLDPSLLPKGLADKMQRIVSADEITDDDVLPMFKAG